MKSFTAGALDAVEFGGGTVQFMNARVLGDKVLGDTVGEHGDTLGHADTVRNDFVGATSAQATRAYSLARIPFGRRTTAITPRPVWAPSQLTGDIYVASSLSVRSPVSHASVVKPTTGTRAAATLAFTAAPPVIDHRPCAETRPHVLTVAAARHARWHGTAAVHPGSRGLSAHAVGSCL